MLTQRYRVLVMGGLILAVAWAVGLGIYWAAERARVTPEKFNRFAASTDLAALSGDARRQALERLARMLNALSAEDRRDARMSGVWEKWFRQMTDAEKEWFIEATLPKGVQQMLTAFEELPDDRRRRAIDDSVKRLREARGRLQSGQWAAPTNAPPLDEELQRKMVTVGLKSFYSASSAQTKAEMAPLLEELQRLMESGRYMRDRRR